MAAPPRSYNRISELAGVIKHHADLLDDYYKSHDLAPPSLEAGSKRPSLGLDAVQSRHAMLVAITELEPLLLDPQDYIIRRSGPEHGVYMSLQAVHRLKLAHKLEPGEEITFDELASRADSPVPLKGSDIQQWLRLAMSWWFFEEPRRGYVRHTLLSESLRDHLNHQWAGFLAEDCARAFATSYEAMIKWPGSQEPHEAASTLILGKPFFETLDATTVQRFSDAMSVTAAMPNFDSRFLFQNLDWKPETAPTTLVDVGGSQGRFAKEFAEKFPQMKCVVQDRPEVIELLKGETFCDGRVTFQVHDFFTPQKTPADVYFLRNILHDWSDKYSVLIIQALIPALRPGTKVVINEQCHVEPLAIPNFFAQRLRGIDMVMKNQFNAKERDEEEWVALFKKASPHFKLVRNVNKPFSALSILEFVWESAETSAGTGQT